MLRKRYIHISNSGYTLVEMMVAMSLGLLVMGIGSSVVFSARQSVFYDFARTKLNQDMRGAFDILSSNIRQAGENLPTGFPAIELEDGGAGRSDQLILRRNLEEQVMTVCASIAAGGSSPISFAQTAIDPTKLRKGCMPTDAATTTRYNAWRAYRLAGGGNTNAYVYNYATLNGEFFKYTGESLSATSGTIQRSGSLATAYTIAPEPADSSVSAYLLEEYRFRLSTTAPNAGVLQIVKDGDVANAMNVASDITNFSVTITMADGTVKTSLAKTDSWKTIKRIDIALTGATKWSTRTITSSLTGRFVPRNVFSK